MTREEAIDRIKDMHSHMLFAEDREALETLIPELAESEDEKIIKTLQEYVKNRNWRLNGPSQREVLEWLEKQKEQDECPEYCVRSHCMGCSIYEKQKEQEHICDSAQYEDGFKTGLEIGLRKQKEQKPIDIDYISGIREELLGIENNARNIDGLTESQWVSIRAAHRLLGEYIEEEQKPWKVGANAYFTPEQKPAWSEEDEKMRDRIIDILNRTFSVYSALGTSSTKPSCPTYKDEIDWLKSLPERFSYQTK